MRTLAETEKAMRKAQREAARYRAVLRRISGIDPTCDARAAVELAREALKLPIEVE